MSKLLKSKFVFGVLIVVFALSVGVLSADAAYMHSVTLKQGSTGAQVISLQTALGITADGKFGPMTKQAVVDFQSANGLVADGVVGPMTGGVLAGGSATVPATGSLCPNGKTLASNCTEAPASTATGTLCPNGNLLANNCAAADGSSSALEGSNLAGGAGSITISALSTYGDEQVGENEEDAKVLAFEVEADNDSDVEITSVKVELNQQDTTNSEDLNDYMSSVSVWMNSDKVGEADEEDFSETTGHVWSKTISLDGAIVRAGETEKFYLAITSLSNLDSGDINDDDWQIGVSSVRFLDAEGVTSTESLTLDIDDNVIDDTLEEEFDFASFATASDVELKAALNDDDDEINEGHVINVETGATETDNVELLSFTLKAEGSDINVAEIPVIFTAIDVAAGALDESTVFTSASLFWNDEEVSTKSVPAGGIVTFDELDIDIAEDDTEEFLITVNLNDLTGDLDPGDQVKVELDGTRVDLIDAEDESGEDLAGADLTGTALGEYSSTYDSGIMLDFVSVSKEKTHTLDPTIDDEDQGTFKITFDVTAFDADMFIDFATEDDGDANTAADDAGEGVDFEVYEDSANGTAADASYEVLNKILESSSVDTEDTATSFAIDEDATRRFTLTVVLEPDTTGTADSNGTFELRLDSVNWGTVGDGTDANFYDFNLDEYKTGGLFLVENDV